MKYISLSLPGGYNIQPPSGIPTGGLEKGGDGQKLIQLGIEIIFVAGVSLAVIFVIISGIQWITSGGDEKKVEAAKGRLTYSIIGLLIVAGAFFIVSTVISLFGGTPSFFLNQGSQYCDTHPNEAQCDNGTVISP